MNEIGEMVWRTIAVSGAALVLGMAFGLPLGAWLGLARFRGRRLLVGMIHVGMGLPPVVVGLLVYLLLARSGPLGSLDALFTPTAMIVAQTILAVPLIAGVTSSALAALPEELAVQLRSLGASAWQVRLALLREARGGMIVGLAAALGRILSEVGASLMVGGNIQGHTRVLSTAIVLETSKGEFAVALALSGWLLGLSLLVNALLLRETGKWWR